MKGFIAGLMEDVAAFISDFKLNAIFILASYIIEKYIIEVKLAIQKYIFDDYSFSTFFFIMLCLDAAAYINKQRVVNHGIKALHLRNGGERLLDNVIKYGIGLVAIHGLSKYSVNGVANTWFTDAPNWFFAFCMLRVITNIFRNLGFDVSLILDKISDKFKDFKVKDEEETIKPD